MQKQELVIFYVLMTNTVISLKSAPAPVTVTAAHNFNSLFVRDACDEGNDIALVDDLVVAFMF